MFWMKTWQPIATAPRDGTEVDLWCIGPPDERFKFAHRLPEVSWDAEAGVWGDRGAPDSWFSHWIPISEGPEEIFTAENPDFDQRCQKIGDAMREEFREKYLVPLYRRLHEIIEEVGRKK